MFKYWLQLVVWNWTWSDTLLCKSQQKGWVSCYGETWAREGWKGEILVPDINLSPRLWKIRAEVSVIKRSDHWEKTWTLKCQLYESRCFSVHVWIIRFLNSMNNPQTCVKAPSCLCICNKRNDSCVTLAVHKWKIFLFCVFLCFLNLLIKVTEGNHPRYWASAAS